MYGSCQRSSGITPRYASAAAFTIAKIASRSSSRHRRIAIRRRLVGEGFDGWRAALAEKAARGLGGQPAPCLVPEASGRDLARHGRELHRVAIGADVEHDGLAGLVLGP